MAIMEVTYMGITNYLPRAGFLTGGQFTPWGKFCQQKFTFLLITIGICRSENIKNIWG